MARIPLGGLTTLNLSTHLDPMFVEIYGWQTGTFPGSNISYSGTLTGGTGVVNLGSGQFYKDAGGLVGIGTVSPGQKLEVNVSVPAMATAGMRLKDATSSGFIDIVRTGTSYSFGGIGANQGWLYSSSDINIGSDGAFGIRLVANAGTRMFVSAAGVVTPGADNTQTFGSGALRWSVIYAGTGTINTSDAREKTAVAKMTGEEISAAAALAKEIGVFQFLNARAEKGSDVARLHIGMTVQRAMEVMSSFGLDPLRYAFICHDSWAEENYPAEYKTEQRDTGMIGGDGSPVLDEVKILVKEAYSIPAGDRYSFRPDQLALFIARGQEERIRRLEERML